MYNFNIRKWSWDLRSKVTKSEKHRPNAISPAVTAVLVETLFSQAGQIQKAKNFLEKSNFARKSVVLTSLAHSKHWAFPWKFLQRIAEADGMNLTAVMLVGHDYRRRVDQALSRPAQIIFNGNKGLQHVPRFSRHAKCKKIFVLRYDILTIAIMYRKF